MNKQTYEIYVRCSNCGWSGPIRISKGTTVPNKGCPQCGCRTLIRGLRP